MDPEIAIHEFLEYVVVQLIRHPEGAGVRRDREGGRWVYRIRLHPEDAGRVIGRGGRTISAIRSLAAASAERHGIEVEVELLEPGGETAGSRLPG